jgi:hypothetical protein
MMADASQHVAWALVAAGVGTYLCRAMGVKLSGHIHQESEIFRWLLDTVPLWIRMGICVLSVGVMVSHPKRRMVPALMTGTLLMLLYGGLR